MRIAIWLKVKEEEIMISQMNLESNPFSIGDVVDISYRDISRQDYCQGRAMGEYGDKRYQEMKSNSDAMKSLVHLKKVKLTNEYKQLDESLLGESKLSIEYYCDLIED